MKMFEKKEKKTKISGKRPLALARSVDGAVREASLLPRCPRGPLARFRVSPSVSDSPPVLRPLAVPVRSARLSMAASQTAAVHESLLACLTRGPTVVDIFKGARGTPVARDQRQSRASKGRWRTCGAWLRAGSRFLRSPVCQRGGGHRRTALRRGQEAGGPGECGEKRSKSAGKIGTGEGPDPSALIGETRPAPVPFRCICVARRCCTLRSAVAEEIRGSWSWAGQPRAAMTSRCEMSRACLRVYLQQQEAKIWVFGVCLPTRSLPAPR